MSSNNLNLISAMKYKILLLALALMPGLALAEVERSLAKSPDGRFELVLTTESNHDSGRVLVRDLKSGGATDTDSGQGYAQFPADDIEAEGKDDSTAFAVTMRGTKRTRNTDVYIRDADIWEKLEFPPYVANILGRQGVFKGGRNLYEEFGGFKGNSKFVLLCHIEPDWQEQEEAAKNKDWKPTTQTEWKVVLEYHHRMRPNCTVESITPNEDKTANKAVEATAISPAVESESTPPPHL